MVHPFRKIACCVCAFLFTAILWGCTESPQTETTQPTIQSIIPTGTTVPETPPLDSSAFSYQELPIPEALASAHHLYRCYQDETYTLLSVCSRNEAQAGPMVKTDYLALYEQSGGMVSYPLETDAYIISAIPYLDGVLYVDHAEQADGGVAWSVILTDGAKETVLDTGTASVYDHTPFLFLVQNMPYYLCRSPLNDYAGYSVKRIKKQTAVTVYAESDCRLMNIDACSNGEQFCCTVKYPLEEFSRLCVFDRNGIQYQHLLSGNPTSYTITDRYAVCNTGTEDNRKLTIEAVDLATGEVTMFHHPYGALYGLAGTGSICVCNASGKVYAVDIENQRLFTILRLSMPSFFDPAGENRFFVLSGGNDGYKFYLLTISE